MFVYISTTSLENSIFWVKIAYMKGIGLIAYDDNRKVSKDKKIF